MQKLILAFSLLAIAPTICSEKNWLQQKVDIFAKKLVTRHTYEHNSLEHCRDRTLLLCVLPAKVSQIVLKQQRNNMQQFLIRNEDDAYEGIRKYFNFDQQKFANLLTTFNREHQFNVEAMKKDLSCEAYHDTCLPTAWINALNKEARRYGTNNKNLNLTSDASCLASSRTERPSTEGKYIPGKITVDIAQLSLLNLHQLSHVATHEYTHTIQGHTMKEVIVIDERLQQASQIIQQAKEKLEKTKKRFSTEEESLKLKLEIESLIQEADYYQKMIANYFGSSEQAMLTAANEKTADTFIACTDAQAARNAALFTAVGPYKKNHNDMNVIHANWQTSQAITSSQQLKSSITQKLRVFPKSVV